MTTNHVFKTLLVLLGTALAAVPMTAVADSGTDISPAEATALGSYKAAHDTDPHLVIVNQVRTHSVVAASVPVSYLMTKDQQGQNYSYYCGPAAVAEANKDLGETTTSQGATASQLRTTTSGTAWSGVNANIPSSWITGYPVRDVMNYDFYVQYGWSPSYAVAAVPYTPTSTDTNNYISRMTFDVSDSTSWWSGFPVVGDAWEVAGYPHLTGHPGNLTIFHWFTIIGYQSSGTYTSYEDSATTVWTTVPAYTYSFSSSTLVLILGGRGYVW